MTCHAIPLRQTVIQLESQGQSTSGQGRLDEPKPAAAKQAQAGASPLTLSDCLACSGCVTSAEAVLVNLQSRAEVERALTDNQVRWWMSLVQHS